MVKVSSRLFPEAPHLFPFGYPPTGNDDNLVFLVKCYDLSNAVGGAGVVDVAGKDRKRHVEFLKKNLRNNKSSVTEEANRHLPSWATGQSCINHLLIVDPEHVDAAILSRKTGAKC